VLPTAQTHHFGDEGVMEMQVAKEFALKVPSLEYLPSCQGMIDIMGEALKQHVKINE